MGDYATVNCPECERRGNSPDTKEKLYVYGETRGWHCFKCGWHGSRGTPPGVEISELRVGDVLDRPAAFPSDSVEFLLRHARPATTYKRAIRYLHGRGITDDQIRTSKILYAIQGPYAERVIFPIFEAHTERILYFVARTVKEGVKPPYVNAPTPKNGYVYPVGTFPAQVAVIVEGVFDAFACLAAGLPAIALLGKSLNQAQAGVIGLMARKAIVALDEDAFAKSLDVSRRLSFHVPTVRINLPPGMDPDKILKEYGPINLSYMLQPEMTELKKQLTGESDEPIKRFRPVARTGKRSRKQRALLATPELPVVPEVEDGEEPVHAAFRPNE